MRGAASFGWTGVGAVALDEVTVFSPGPEKPEDGAVLPPDVPVLVVVVSFVFELPEPLVPDVPETDVEPESEPEVCDEYVVSVLISPDVAVLLGPLVPVPETSGCTQVFPVVPPPVLIISVVDEVDEVSAKTVSRCPLRTVKTPSTARRESIANALRTITGIVPSPPYTRARNVEIRLSPKKG
jgi:hypothetical protein